MRYLIEAFGLVRNAVSACPDCCALLLCVCVCTHVCACVCVAGGVCAYANACLKAPTVSTCFLFAAFERSMHVCVAPSFGSHWQHGFYVTHNTVTHSHTHTHTRTHMQTLANEHWLPRALDALTQLTATKKAATSTATATATATAIVDCSTQSGALPPLFAEAKKPFNAQK